MEVLHQLNTELLELDLSDEENETAYKLQLDRIMETSEGIFLYVMTYLYNFDYLSEDVVNHELSMNQTLSLWQETMVGYCDQLEVTLVTTNAKM